MDRWTVVRRFTFGALVTGLVPLAGLGVHAAGAGESSAALCHSTFGDGGPTGDRIVGEVENDRRYETTSKAIMARIHAMEEAEEAA